VSLTNNTGATINFTPTAGGNGLDITTAAGTGFNATGGGTVSVTGAGNSINSTSGTALNVSNTTIGANDVTFQSISSGTASNSSATGIILDTTGSLGGLHVTGNGANVGATGGGVIQHKTGADGTTSTGVGIYLNNTSDVQLNGMQLNDFDNFGIKGVLVTGFSLDHSTVNGISGSTTSPDEGAIFFTNLLGTSSISNSTVQADLRQLRGASGA
jgi:hypothetical protein